MCVLPVPCFSLVFRCLLTGNPTFSWSSSPCWVWNLFWITDSKVISVLISPLMWCVLGMCVRACVYKFGVCKLDNEYYGLYLYFSLPFKLFWLLWCTCWSPPLWGRQRQASDSVCGVRKMAHLLCALSTLVKDRSSVPNTHVRWLTTDFSQLQGIWHPVLASQGTPPTHSAFFMYPRMTLIWLFCLHFLSAENRDCAIMPSFLWCWQPSPALHVCQANSQPTEPTFPATVPTNF